VRDVAMKIRLAAFVLSLGICLGMVAAEPTPADLEHGKRQVERMLADRQGMAVYRREKDNKAGYVEEGNAIYRWAVEAYAGKYVGERVYWVQGEPVDGGEACHVNARLYGIYALQIRNAGDDQPDGFEVMWSGCIYEMLSMSQMEEWASLEKGAIDNLFSAEEFVEEGARVEWLAHRKLAKFHEEVWAPWARLVGVKSDREIWVMANSEVYENWRAQYTEREHYPWQPFLQIYEWLSRFSEDKILRYRKLDSASR
jgi:predicted lipoprotein with Yx(FWY)xxD motif